MPMISLHIDKSKWLRKYLIDFMGSFPTKCLSCFKAGICYCRFWSFDFNCEIVDKMREMEKLEALLSSFPHQSAVGGDVFVQEAA